MQVPLQITIRNMQHSDALEAHIRDKVVKLAEFHPRITSCRVTVEESGKHHRQGRQFQVRVDVRVPQHELVATRDQHEDVYVALRDAFDATKRQLEELVREQRGDVKVHELPQHGKVARLLADEGYGFIETADGRELYFSRVRAGDYELFLVLGRRARRGSAWRCPFFQYDCDLSGALTCSAFQFIRKLHRP